MYFNLVLLLYFLTQDLFSQRNNTLHLLLLQTVLQKCFLPSLLHDLRLDLLMFETQRDFDRIGEFDRIGG